tara:strand:- start:664 stop:1560 length:897 start_codon:yes stop_codon:yes gene_type:complete
MPIITRNSSNQRSSLQPTNETDSNRSNLNQVKNKRNSSYEVRPDNLTYEEILSVEPEIGRIVYDKTNETERYWDGSSWQSMSGTSSSVGQRAANYSSLTEGSVVGELAYCNQSQGTQWLPYTLGGTYYPSGWYLWDGSVWISDRNNIVNQLQLNVDGLGGKANVVHTHIKADITDFDDDDYADYMQGLLANTAIQPNDNISVLNNDSSFLIESQVEILIEEAITESDYYKEFTYLNGSLSKIETYSDNTKATKLFTKDLTFSSGVLIQISETNETASTTDTKNFVYDGSGNLINITKT